MTQLGTTVTATEIPVASVTNWNTQNHFMPVLADWGPFNTPIAVTSLGNAASQIGTPTGSGVPANSRTATCAIAYDAVQTMLAEDGNANPTIYISRVGHGTPTAATISLGPSNALTFTAQYAGAGGNGIYVAVTNNTSTYTITLTDALGNTLAVSPALSTPAAGVPWAATTGLVTAVSSGATLPATAAATAMSGGTDNRSSITLADVTTALNALSSSLGPGQVLAPNWTNTTLSGIWSALGTHAQANNRYAIFDMDDNQSATTEIADYGSFGSSTVAGWGMFWAGNRNLPGITPGTNRSIPLSPIVAGKCALADQNGNPGQMAAGPNFPIVYATTPTSQVTGAPYDTYSAADMQTLWASNINVCHYLNGPMLYGFRSAVPQTVDGVYYQAQHGRVRMAVTAAAQQIGQKYVFAQLDGQGATQSKFANDLTNMLTGFFQAGALYGATPTQAFAVDTGPDVNTPTTIAAGQLNALLTIAMSPGAESVQITINVVPITTAV